MSKKTTSNLLLLLTALIWGSAFVAQKAGTVLEPMTYNGIRTLIGGISLFPLVALMPKLDKKRKKAGRDEDASSVSARKSATIKGGLVCGIFLAIASTLQQYGMYFDTDAGIAGFITALYIVMVPILGILLGKKPKASIWISVIMGAAGFYFLTMAGHAEAFALTKGYVCLLLCALAFSCHILAIDHFSPKADGVKLSCIQFITCGLICIVGMVLFENPSMAAILNTWFPIIYAGVFSCGIGYTLQIIAQKNADPASASLILSLESVFSVLTGALILGEKLTFYQVMGCGIIFLAVIIAQKSDKNEI